MLMYGYADSKVIIVEMIPRDQSVGWICTGMWLGPAIKIIQKNAHAGGYTLAVRHSANATAVAVWLSF